MDPEPAPRHWQVAERLMMIAAALTDSREQGPGDHRNQARVVRPLVSRQEDVRKNVKISALEGRLAHWQHRDTGTSHRNLKLSGSNLSEVITAQAHTPWRRTT